jgi:DNA invertase Pin-like site-specific DNA recombinase
MATLGATDVVIAPAVDRLSRDTTDFLVITRNIQQTEDGLCSLTEPHVDPTSDFTELVPAMLSVMAKFKRRRIIERMAHRRVDAKANDGKFGYKPKLTSHPQCDARQQIENGETQCSVARSYNLRQTAILKLRCRDK